MLCRRRKRFEDNLVLVANENSVDSLEVTEKKKKWKLNESFDSTDSGSKESCDKCSQDRKNCCSDSEDTDHEGGKEVKITSFRSRGSVSERQSLNETIEVQIETDPSADRKAELEMIGKMPVGPNDNVDTPLKNMDRDDFATYLSTKLQRHVDEQFVDAELESQKLDVKDKSTQSSSLTDIDQPGFHVDDNRKLVALNRVNKNSFLNKFRATVMLRGKEMKEKGNNKLKKIMKRESKEENFFKEFVMKRNLKEEEGSHPKIHAKLDAET